MSNLSGVSDLVRQVREVSDNIDAADRKTALRLDQIEASINELFKKSGRPGPSRGSLDDDEYASAVEMCQIRHYDRSPKNDGLITKAYEPASSEVSDALLYQKAFDSYLRTGGDVGRLDPQYTKALSAFSFGGSGYMLPPQTAGFKLRCLADPSNLSGLVRSMPISAPSLRILIDNTETSLGEWSCESGCFGGQPNPDLTTGLGWLELKPETIRMTLCCSRDFLEDAATDPQAFIRDKLNNGLSATINNALIVGDGNSKPMGLLNPKSNIPVCETSEATPPGRFSWTDLVMLAYQIPQQWHSGASFLMNQHTFSLLLTMQDAMGRPLLSQLPQNAPAYSLAGFPIVIASQMPDPEPGATPVAFGNWKEAYLVVWRKQITIQVDPYSAGFCVLFKAEARVSGGCTCPNKARLLRIR